MKQKKPENQETMSTGELLGRLKKSYSADDEGTKTFPTVSAEPDASDDDLDIAALLRQYLPDAERTSAENEPASDTIEFSIPESRTEEPVSAEEDVFVENPLRDFVPDTDAGPAPVSGSVRRQVYRFRPSSRNFAAQTVKITETVREELPLVQTPNTAASDGYFSGKGKTDFVIDDEIVLPDESAFDELIPSLHASEPAPDMRADAESEQTRVFDTAEVLLAEDTKQDEAGTASTEETSPVQNAEVDESVSDVKPESKAELDDTDINLMIALGYEEELQQTVGIDRVNEIEEKLDKDASAGDTRDSAAFRGFEYTEKEQAKEIMQNYRAEYNGTVLRLIGSILLLVALFFYENISLLGVELPGALNMRHFPSVHTLVSLQLLVLSAALSWRELFAGLRSAVTFKPTPQSLGAVAVLVAVLYDLIIALVAPSNGVMLYNFPAALCLTLMALYDLMSLKREIFSFTVVADRHEKYAARSVLLRDAVSGEEELTLDVRRSAFVSRYFARTNAKSVVGSHLNFVLLPVLAVSLALAFISLSMHKDGVGALNVFALTNMFCLPVSTLIAYSYPLFRAAQIAFEDDTAILGEASAEEYSGASVISFADTDMFPSYSVKLRSIKLYGNARPDLVLFGAASVFSRVGGPLADVLELATMEFDSAESVELIRIAEDGIEAIVDGQSILIGREDFLSTYDVHPLRDADDDANGERILYIVMDGVLCAKLYIQYEMDTDFEDTLRALTKEEITAKIRTYDPNIDEELLAVKLRGKPFAVQIDKQMEEPAEPGKLEEIDSGLVSRSSAKALVRPALLCSRLAHVRRTGSIIRTVALVVSLLIMLLLTVLSSSVSITSVYVALYQIFWIIPSLIITRLFIK